MEPYVVKNRIEEFVKLAALGGLVKAFYPSAAAKYANTSISLAFKYLLNMTETGELFLKWELRCPNIEFECSNIIEITNNRRNNDIIECPKCGYEFELHVTDFFPRFEINPKYKKYIQDCFKQEPLKKKPKTINLI